MESCNWQRMLAVLPVVRIAWYCEDVSHSLRARVFFAPHVQVWVIYHHTYVEILHHSLGEAVSGRKVWGDLCREVPSFPLGGGTQASFTFARSSQASGNSNDGVNSGHNSAQGQYLQEGSATQETSSLHHVARIGEVELLHRSTISASTDVRGLLWSALRGICWWSRIRFPVGFTIKNF